MSDLKSKIRHVPDFPKAGILFYDITTLLRDPEGFRLAIDSVAEPFRNRGISLVIGIESRGFILGAAVADRIGAGFVPVRKLGKLPSACVRATYERVLPAMSGNMVKGDPTHVADVMEDWYTSKACDGFVLSWPRGARPARQLTWSSNSAASSKGSRS